MMMLSIQHIPFIQHGRTFVCGDIHGCFSLFEEKLTCVQFDAEKDRVLCVGDLIDRGSESIRALEFLSKPWFYSVMGNHERMLLDILSGDLSMEAVWLHDGGAWFYEQVPKAEWNRWKEALSALPVLIEVETLAGLVGIVHADLPKGVSWQQFTGLIQENNPTALTRALKSRFRVSSRLCEFVPGVHRIYCGHSLVPEPRLQGNVWCMDTGAYLGDNRGSLTLMEVGDETLS